MTAPSTHHSQLLPISILAFLAFCFSGGAFAQAPANDDFANAQVITGVFGNFNGSNVDATMEKDDEPEKSLGKESGHSVWFRWQAPVSGSFAFSLTADFSWQLVAFTGTMVDDNLTAVAESNEDGSGGESVTIEVVEGDSYHVRVTGNRSAAGSFILNMSGIADLSGLALSAGTLSPGFASGTLDFTANVNHTTNSITLTPTVAQANATVKVNNTTVASGSPSGAIGLGYGRNTITTVVTAQDGIKTKTYTVVVTRAAPNPVTATFNAASDMPLTTNGFSATGNTVNLTLNFTPAPGTVLRVINNTGQDFINGVFDNLAQGEVVPLSYDGETYTFVANYYGGTGNDLVLQWSSTAPMAWGFNYNGQLGNSNTANSLIPTGVSTSGVLASKTIIAVAAGSVHSLALCSDGTLAAWGDNSAGQLGNDSTAPSSVPVAIDVSAGSALDGKRVIAVAAGNLHSLALCSDGTLAAWGNNSAGQLGNGSTVQSNVPVAVSTDGVLAGKTVVGMAGGNVHNLARCSDGTLVAWGNNIAGQLGNDSTVPSGVPVAVSTDGVLAGKTVVAVSAGNAHSLAICSDGTTTAWGDNSYGQLGNGNNSPSDVPVAVNTAGVLASKTVVGIAAGADHSLCLCSDGTLAAWGWNGEGELGNNSTADSNLPVTVVATGVLLAKTVVAVSAGQYHSLVACSDGTMAAWGFNGDGELGNNSTAMRRVPATVSMVTLPAGSRFMVGKSGPIAAHSLGIAATPADPPTAVTAAAIAITSSTATLAGSVNPNGRATEVYFRYGPTTSYGLTTPVQSLPLGVTAVDITAPITGLSPSGVYHYQIIATSIGGAAFGLDTTFETTAVGIPTAPPSVTTDGTTDLTTTTATLQGTVNPNGGITNAWFDYGTTVSYGSVTSNLGAGSGNTPGTISTGITDLQPGTLYYYRLVAENSLGIAYGPDATFTTLFPPPTVTSGGSEPAAGSTTSVRVSGTVRARHASTDVFFDYGTDGVTFPNTLAATPATVTGDDATAVTADLPNLLQGTTYYYRVRGVSVGGTTTGSIASFQTAVISGLLQQFPSAAPEAEGYLFLVLNPPGMGGWRFVGEQQWRTSGVSAGGFTTGDREIEFRPVPGYQQPLRELVTITSGAPATSLTREYFELVGPGGAGGIVVTIKPESIALPSVPEADRAQWRLLGDDDTEWRDSGVPATDIFPGTHLVECKPVTGRATPTPVSVFVEDGQTKSATVTYRLADAPVGTPASVVSFEVVTAAGDHPYTHVGQIRSDLGSSSGFVVKPRVVATAAHVVFDDGNLEYVTGLNWNFQRDRGNYEPTPQIPRGFYVFDAYSARRTAENTPGESSPDSQNLDAAALYFLEDAGRGGYGGFLASDLTDNEFLLSSAQKSLVGYPVDGIPPANQGRMHATPPANVTFTRVPGTDPDSGDPYRLYATADISSSGGNSGGPICVQHDGGAYYAAAIFLGGSAQTIVRAIDSDIIDLFNRAETSANGGGNTTGGGIVPVDAEQTIDSFGVGLVEVTTNLTGAGWRILSIDPTDYYRDSGTTLAMATSTQFTIVFEEVAGFAKPSDIIVTPDSALPALITGNYLPAGYVDWVTTELAGYPADQTDPLADPNFNGISNLLAFAFGLSTAAKELHYLTPGTGTSGLPAIYVESSAGEPRLSIEFVRRRAPAGAGIEYRCEFGSSLSDGNFSPATKAKTVTSIDELWERVVVQDSETLTSAAARFGRVSVKVVE